MLKSHPNQRQVQALRYIVSQALRAHGYLETGTKIELRRRISRQLKRSVDSVLIAFADDYDKIDPDGVHDGVFFHRKGSPNGH